MSVERLTVFATCVKLSTLEHATCTYFCRRMASARPRNAHPLPISRLLSNTANRRTVLGEVGVGAGAIKLQCCKQSCGSLKVKLEKVIARGRTDHFSAKKLDEKNKLVVTYLWFQITVCLIWGAFTADKERFHHVTMTVIFEHDLDKVMMNQHAKYVGEGLFILKDVVQTRINTVILYEIRWTLWTLFMIQSRHFERSQQRNAIQRTVVANVISS